MIDKHSSIWIQMDLCVQCELISSKTKFPIRPN